MRSLPAEQWNTSGSRSESRDGRQRGDDRVATLLEHRDVPVGEELDGVLLGAVQIALPHLLEQRQMVIRRVHRLAPHATVVVELAAGAEIEHRPNPERRDSSEVGAFDAVDAIGAVDAAPPHRLPGLGRVAAEVAEVEGPFEGDAAWARVLLDSHVGTVPIAGGSQLAGG